MGFTSNRGRHFVLRCRIQITCGCDWQLLGGQREAATVDSGASHA
jgi:hypothetical protein